MSETPRTLDDAITWLYAEGYEEAGARLRGARGDGALLAGRPDVAGLVEALGHQAQVDEDGIMCGVSRQAVDEARSMLQSLDAQLAQAERNEAAIRELMNVYNLGGWTDAEGPMRRALEAGAERDALKKDSLPLPPFGDILGHNYWMDVNTLNALWRRMRKAAIDGATK